MVHRIPGVALDLNQVIFPYNHWNTLLLNKLTVLGVL